jgi:uncharacterized protein
MLITVSDLEREPLEFNQTISPGIIEYGSAIRQLDGMPAQGRAELILEHRGARQVISDIRLRADFQGRFEVLCARCLEPVEHTLSEHLDLIFRPLGADAGSPERAISTSDAEIGYYQDGGLVLEDVLREQVLLSMPARILCREDCKGLCPSCGRNLNQEACACDAVPSDPRWNALADFRGKMKT